MTKNLIESFDSSLKGLFSDLEINKIKEVSSNFFNTNISLDSEQREKLQEKLYEQFDFVNKKIKELQQNETLKLINLKTQITIFFQKNYDKFTPTYIKLQDLKNQIENYLKSFDLNLNNIKEFNNKITKKFECDAKKLMYRIKYGTKTK